MLPRVCTCLLPAAIAAGLVASGPVGLAFGGAYKAPVRRRRTAAVPGPVKAEAKSSDKSSPVENSKTAAEPETVNVLAAVKAGQIAAKAEGRGDGKITLSITNRTGHPLRVVLPPGLVASGTTGQFGGMGGMGGGMGGGMMGGMGGGMGGMGGGMMGGMGGGMGGMGGMRGGMGGMGGMRGGGTMPASMGMMMLARVIMNFCGERDSWDMRSLMMGMGGMGMGGMGMGGMGGGMGGGMMGGGFRSVPPTGLPEAVLEPGQTRHLPTPVVNLGPPSGAGQVGMPAKGEALQIGDVGEASTDPRVRAALTRLAAEKAPQTVSQLVIWQLTTEMSWDAIAQAAQPWANAQEVALARGFVGRLGGKAVDSPVKVAADPGAFYWGVSGDAAALGELKTVLNDRTVLGLKAVSGIPANPDGPSVACEARVSRESGPASLDVRLAVTDGSADHWVSAGRFSLPLTDAKTKKPLTAAEVADGLAEGVLNRLVHARLVKGHKVKGKETYTITIRNASPLVLNGLALAGAEVSAESPPSLLTGLCLPPRKSFTVPATAEAVDRLRLKDGVRVLAADLSGL